MLLVIQSHIVPAVACRERGAFGALLIAIFLAQTPVGCFNGEHGNARIVEDLCIVTTSSTFRIVFVQSRIGAGYDTAAVRDGQRPVARQFSHRFRGFLTAIEIELIADDQVIEVDNQQRIFLLGGAHSLQDVLRAQFAFFLAAGGDKSNAVLRRHVFEFFCQFQHHAKSCGVVINTLQGQSTQIGIGIGVALCGVGVEVRHDNNLLWRFTLMCGNNGTSRDVMPVFTVIFGGINITAIKRSNITAVAHLLKLLTNIISRQHFCRRARYAAWEKRCDISSLGICDISRFGRCCLCGKDKARAERQDCKKGARCGKHNESLNTKQKFLAASMKP